MIASHPARAMTSTDGAAPLLINRGLLSRIRGRDASIARRPKHRIDPPGRQLGCHTEKNRLKSRGEAIDGVIGIAGRNSGNRIEGRIKTGSAGTKMVLVGAGQ